MTHSRSATAQGLALTSASKSATRRTRPFSTSTPTCRLTVEGSEQAFADLLPGLQKIDPALADTVRTSFQTVDSALEKYRSTSEPSGYVLFDSLTNADKQRLAAAVKAVQEPLSRVASKVAGS